MYKKISICLIFFLVLTFIITPINNAMLITVENEFQVLNDNDYDINNIDLDKESIVEIHNQIEKRNFMDQMANVGSSSALAEIDYIGGSDLFAGGFLGEEAMYLRIDGLAGEILWKKTWASSSGDAQIWGVTKGESESIGYACGTIYTSNDEYAKGFILKIDLDNGEIINSKIVSKSDGYYSFRDIQYYQNAIYVVGTYDHGEGSAFYPSALRIKYDKNLEKEWGKYHTFFGSLAWGYELVIAKGNGYVGGTCLAGTDHADLQALITEFELSEGDLGDYSNDYGFTWYTENGWGLTYSDNTDCLYIATDERTDFSWYAKVTKVKRNNGEELDWERYPFAGTAEDCKAYDIAWDDDLKVHMTGYSMDYTGGDAIYLKMKESLTGSFEEKHWGGSGADCGWGINVDNFGNVFIVGATTSYSSKSAAFALKYSLSGTLRWEIVLAGNSPPNRPDEPYGNSMPTVGNSYYYTASTTDYEGDDLYYKFDWGDGTTSEWLGPYNSGETCKEYNSWSKVGNFEIKVKAKDIHAEQSGWSPPRSITVTKSRSMNLHPQLFDLINFLINFSKII
jgi:hypothetical protein